MGVTTTLLDHLKASSGHPPLVAPMLKCGGKHSYDRENKEKSRFRGLYTFQSRLTFFEVFFKQLKHASVLLFANKQDLKGSMTSAEISQQLNLTSIKDHGWHIQACCALTGEGLYSGLEWIVNQRRK
ncbi:ADP-ribosylation factor 5B [Paramuricea clavata]|uniref:ADP-ribosylation factor 5B n=1 Tax=Paramuricea clavata TaxID=317549 RepID=A0A7D9J9X5_PARCT|nr:ADP-ribosylation factor 5B [Paramuricea clavata]